MYSSFQLVQKYLQYRLKALNGKGHGVHSPFVYDFIRQVLQSKITRSEKKAVEDTRAQLIQDKRLLTIQDFGAGSAIQNQQKRTVASIAKNSLKSPKYAGLMYKIARHYQPKTILELGTCLGITTTYLAKACPQAHITTMEGAPQVAKVAQEVFIKAAAGHIDLITGNFDDTLLPFINQIKEANKKIDLVFIDGNHREAPTYQYFKQLLDIKHEGSIFIFDDVHWSVGMENAWQRIKEDDEVTLSIDLFFIGIVFFKKDFKVKQHFTIRH